MTFLLPSENKMIIDQFILFCEANKKKTEDKNDDGLSHSAYQTPS